MRLVFLGTAQDAGVPQIGCGCKNCLSITRTAASLAVIDGDGAIVIDVSPDFRFQYTGLIQQYGAHLKAVYLTHAHWGHYGGLMMLGKEGWNIKNLPIFLSQSLFSFLSTNDPFKSLFEGNNVVPHFLNDGELSEHGITAVTVRHRQEYSDTLAFVITSNGRQVLYMPDVDEITPPVENLIRSVDVAIIDGTFYEDSELQHRDMSEIPHPRIVNSAKMLGDIADRVIFTHLNHTNPLLDENSEEFKLLIKAGFRVGRDGDEIRMA